MHIFTPEEWNTTRIVPRHMQNIIREASTFVVLRKSLFSKTENMRKKCEIWGRKIITAHTNYLFNTVAAKPEISTPSRPKPVTGHNPELLWSSGQSFWLQIQRSRIRFPALPDFLRSRGSGTGSTQPHEDN
jgi:hypothetical protein